MLRGLYDFRPINDKTLGFKGNDFLLFLEPHPKDRNWLRVADSNGQVGFVPINFVQVYKGTSSESLLAFLDEAIRRARRDRLVTLDLLTAVRQNIITSPYTTEEHVAQIDAEVTELRARAMATLNYEDQQQQQQSPMGQVQRQAYNPQTAPASSHGAGMAPHGQNNNRETAEVPIFRHHQDQPQLQQAAMIRSEADPQILKGHDKGKKKKKPPAPLPEYVGGKDVQYAQLYHGNGTRTTVATAVVTTGHSGNDHERPVPVPNDLSDGYVKPTPLVPYYHQSQQGQGGGAGVKHQSVCECGRPFPSNLLQSRRSSEPGEDSTYFLPSRPAAEMVDLVRTATGWSHKHSQDAAEAVLVYLTEKLDEKREWSKLRKLLDYLLHNPRVVSTELEVIAESHDAKNIKSILTRLAECKEDQQQRSWALHEDEGMITDHLLALARTLKGADPSISKYVMEIDQYRSISDLVLYYQMETRWNIRTRLIECFKIMGTMDDKAHSILLNSILPMELAREIREYRQNATRIQLCAELLVTLFSSGENIPITHSDYLDSEYISFLLDVIEDPPNEEEKISDCIMHLLFAYNLQFYGGRENMVISALEQRQQNASVFTQKVIYFLNRGVDPLDAYLGRSQRKTPTDSVLKLTTDVFSSQQVADLFYTNDIKVLIDIVTRCVTDLSAGDERRTLYLKLIQVIIRNTNFSEHKHRHTDLAHCFSSILQEEHRETTKIDQAIVREIGAETPDLFGVHV